MHDESKLLGLLPLEVDGEALVLVDQCLLPFSLRKLRIEKVPELIAAIRRLSIRGAPALGLAGAWGLVLAARNALGKADPLKELEEEAARLSASRPTAVNLGAAVAEGMRLLRREEDAEQRVAVARRFAEAWTLQDQRACRAICEAALPLLAEAGGRWLTLCNAGPLATSGVGTAQGALIHGYRQGAIEEVLVCETRPLLQGARLTAWELQQAGVPCRLICDSMAAAAMAELDVRGVIIGADRIAANGDTANKVGSRALACAARFHEIPLLVAAPTTTLDPACPEGAAIPVEERSDNEVRGFGETSWAAPDSRCWNPAFDRTPAELITAVVTENGVHRFPPEPGWIPTREVAR